MDGLKRAGLIESLENAGHGRARQLRRLGIPRSTFYHWRKRYIEGGVPGVERGKPAARRVWNRLREEERATILKVALEKPEISARLIAVHITDNNGFCVSESTVYRLLKEHGLIQARPKDQTPAGKEWRHKTAGPDEIWQSCA